MAGYDTGFGSVSGEYADHDPPVEGSVPEWLSGVLLRNGPGVFETAAGEADHWFDGLAMLRKFTFEEGSVSYSNRVLRTEAYEQAHETGFAGQFSAEGSYLRRVVAMLRGKTTDNANVHVARFGDDHVAITETPTGVRVDPLTLESRGTFEFVDDLTLHHVTAHYRRDPASAAYVGHGTKFGRTNEYVLYRIPDCTQRRKEIARTAVDSPAYLHSVGVTADSVVLVEPPFVADPVDFLKPGLEGFVDAFEWRPDRWTRFLVFDRDSGELRAEVEAPSFFVFHHVNAYEDGDETVVDLVAYPDADIVSDLSLDALAAGPDQIADGRLRRYRIDATGPDGQIEESAELFEGFELPRVAPSVSGRQYEYAYGQATSRVGENGIVKVAVDSGEATTWFDGVYATEPVFVPEPGAEKEDAGVVIAPALDHNAGHSVLLVLDAETMTELARAKLPHTLPFGFHGRFYPEL